MKTWYQIQAKANNPKSAEVSIHDEIGLWGISASAFMRDLKAMGDVDDIHLSIHSPGGDVLDGWAIYNALRNSKARITARVEGLAASMASVILMAADEIQIPKNAYVMIHNPWGMAVGDAEEMRDTAALLDKLQGGLVRAYSERTGNDESDIRAWMDAETWMDGEEAVERGFATVLLDEVAMSAKAFDTRRFKMTPTSVQANSEETPLVAPVDETPQVAPVEETPVEAPVAEVAVEETPVQPPTEEPQAKSLLSRLKAVFGSDTDEVLRASVEARKAELVRAQAEIEKLNATVATLTNDNQIKTKALDEVQAMVAELEAERKTAEAKAAAQIAAAGFDPESESNLPPAETDKGDILAQFNELTGAEKTAFYRAHSKAIKQAQSNL